VIGEAVVAALVVELSLVSFLSSTRPSRIARHGSPTHDLAIQLFRMSGTDNAPRKRKAEPRERQDGGNKRAKVSSFSSCDCENSGRACSLASQSHFRSAAVVNSIMLNKLAGEKELGYASQKWHFEPRYSIRRRGHLGNMCHEEGRKIRR
jgi:hypothetical protein